VGLQPYPEKRKLLRSTPKKRRRPRPKLGCGAKEREREREREIQSKINQHITNRKF
jgi:hypothetical protein